MEGTHKTEATRDFVYIECSLPVGVTIAEYRLSRPRRPSAWRRLRMLAAR